MDKVIVPTLDTGLTSEVIRQEIVAIGLLDKMPQLEVEGLIKHFNRITMKEEERSSKLYWYSRHKCASSGKRFRFDAPGQAVNLGKKSQNSL